MTIDTQLARTEDAGTAVVHVVGGEADTSRTVAAALEGTGIGFAQHFDVEEFLSRLRPDAPACVVMDLARASATDWAALRLLRNQHPQIPVMVSGLDSIANAVDALRHGAVDFLEQPLRTEGLHERIVQALTDGRAGGRKLARTREIQQRIRGLTARQAEIMRMLAAGQTVKRVAFELDLSPKTVQVHRSRILAGMAVDSVVKLANLLNEMAPE